MEQNVNFEQEYRISVDKSKEAMSDKPWGEVDKSALKDKVVNATNFKEIARDIFLDLREGWEDGTKEALKYPVMLIKEDNTAVYNRGALASARAYATKNNEEEVLGRLKKIYEDLELNEEEDEAFACEEEECKCAEGEGHTENCCGNMSDDGCEPAEMNAEEDPAQTCAADGEPAPEGEPAPVEEETPEELKAKLEETRAMCEQLQIALTACEEEKNLYKTELHDALDRATRAESALNEMTAKVETLEHNIHHYYCEDLKRTAEALMANEKIAAGDKAAILEKCEKGEYACDEDIRKDVAYAAYNARPADERRFSVSIESPAHTDAENKKQTLTREQRIAARYAGKNI